MCGIVGMINRAGNGSNAEATILQMLGLIRHRGPDQFGIYLGSCAALGSARLSIIDIAGGQQPIANETEDLWIVFNGEIFNHAELREELLARGHRFSTRTDTEVILHLYEDLGPECLRRLNGQFAIAIWNEREKTLFLARDRVGVRPLYYASANGALVFGSEIKALLACPGLSAELDPLALEQIFTYWCPLSPRTIFRNVREVPPGHFLLATMNGVSVSRYWLMDFLPERVEGLRGGQGRSIAARAGELRELLIDATRIRLRADVPVGCYLSGGLDSSTLAAIVRRCTNNPIKTFSIAFTDGDFDESGFQSEMARHLGTEHQTVCASQADIGRVFPLVVWHAETPLMRTAPAPMFLLSQLVRDSGYKVVLTGEGADEFLAGYDIFKEARLRRLWARHPESSRPALLLQRLYQHVPQLQRGSNAFQTAFFKQGLSDVNKPWFSHSLRWRNNRRACRMFSDALTASLGGAKDEYLKEVEVPSGFANWNPLGRAQYLEGVIFLSQYLLSSQGDRMAMAHSVEGRFPFLDHRVVDFCSHLPAQLKLRGLTEKFLLKQAAADWLPPAIRQRTKQPYRAPISRCFFGRGAPDYVEDLLSPSAIQRSGLFKPDAVGLLLKKAGCASPVGETDEMTLVGVISSQLWHHQFVEDFKMPRPITLDEGIKFRGSMVRSSNLRSP